MSKYRNVRDRQCLRYMRYLCALDVHLNGATLDNDRSAVLVPPVIERWYNRKAHKVAVRANRRQVAAWAANMQALRREAEARAAQR